MENFIKNYFKSVEFIEEHDEGDFFMAQKH